MQEKHNALGPLVGDFFSFAIADEAEHGQIVAVVCPAVIRLPVLVFAPILESLLDLGVVSLVGFAGNGVNHHAAALLGREH